jgi:LmbE family N-acetylglucosaminyl deacetylase
MLSLSRPSAELFVPDGVETGAALDRTTHLAIGAHADDLEFMAAHGILECFQQPAAWFGGVVVTDGAGSPRDFDYADHDDRAMQQVRRAEQKKAASIGEYSFQALLDHPSSAVKSAGSSKVTNDLRLILERVRPRVVYTHNLADKHDTHVAVALRAIAALRALPAAERPQRVIGCEVWRDLDWLCDADKVSMPLEPRREALLAALIGVFDSQIAGGKRYDLACAGRRRAHATFYDSHETDRNAGLIFGMDLTALLEGGDAVAHVRAHIRRFEDDVVARIARFS